MKITLCLPKNPLLKSKHFKRRNHLIYVQAEGQQDTITDPHGNKLQAAEFRNLRDRAGAWIETDNPATVCRTLALPYNEKGITLTITKAP